MARTSFAAVLLLLTFSLGAADAPRFQFLVTKPVKYTMKQTTIVLDDDTKGIPHRLVAVETSSVTLAPGDKGYLLTKQPTNFEVLVDGHHVESDTIGAALKASTISMTLNERGLARKAAGYEAVQQILSGSNIAGRVLPKDLAARDVQSWNDRMLLLNQRSDRGAEWSMGQQDGTVRTWTIADPQPCGPTAECVSVRSKWEADPEQLLKRANTNVSTPLSAARLQIHFESLVDGATLLPHYEKRTSQQFISIPKNRSTIERRITKIDEIDYQY
jgi:hypothetical protein